MHGLITVAARRCAPPFRRGGWRERPRVPWSHEYEEYGGVCVWVPWTPRDMAPRCSAFLLPPSARRGTTSCDHQRIHLGLRYTDRCVDRNLMEWARESSSAWSRIFVARGGRGDHPLLFIDYFLPSISFEELRTSSKQRKFSRVRRQLDPLNPGSDRFARSPGDRACSPLLLSRFEESKPINPRRGFNRTFTRRRSARRFVAGTL